MKTTILSTKNEVIINLVLLLLVLSNYLISIDFSHTNTIRLEPLVLFDVTFIIVYLSTFYLNYLVILPKLTVNFSWINAVLGYLALFIFWSILRALIEQKVTDLLWNTVNYHRETSAVWYLFDNLFFSFPAIITSTLTFISIHYIRNTQRNNLYLEEKKIAEIKLLQSQINPHFIFNTLNNIYSLVYHKSDKALDGIERLSNLLRFLTYESQRNYITLQKEIDYIENFIALETLRLSKPIAIQQTLTIEDPTLPIPPLLLLPLIENAFKHGVITDPTTPLMVKVIQQQNQLTMYTENKINSTKKDKQKGIGLTNIRKRLSLLYPEKSSLKTTEENGVFTCTLYFRI